MSDQLAEKQPKNKSKLGIWLLFIFLLALGGAATYAGYKFFIKDDTNVAEDKPLIVSDDPLKSGAQNGEILLQKENFAYSEENAAQFFAIALSRMQEANYVGVRDILKQIPDESASYTNLSTKYSLLLQAASRENNQFEYTSAREAFKSVVTSSNDESAKALLPNFDKYYPAEITKPLEDDQLEDS